jgi:hypothetical protein
MYGNYVRVTEILEKKMASVLEDRELAPNNPMETIVIRTVVMVRN